MDSHFFCFRFFSFLRRINSFGIVEGRKAKKKIVEIETFSPQCPTHFISHNLIHNLHIMNKFNLIYNYKIILSIIALVHSPHRSPT